MILSNILQEQANTVAILLSLLEAGGDITINVPYDELGHSVCNAINTVNTIISEQE